MDNMDQAMQAADDRTSGSTEVGTYESPCDSDVKPIYPVRYAYANFFESSLQYALPPNDIKTMLSATSLRDALGYVVRLLRPGWIYIKDEDFDTFHIFKYEQQEKTTNGKKQCVERYRKFIFKNGNNAQDGLTPELGPRGEGYYFAFVPKRVSNISIVYSEHEWHADVIDAINGDKQLRKKSMQEINLDANDGPYSLEATEANFTRLIEDYRHKQQRALIVQDKDHPNDLSSIDIDILTTRDSYWMEPDDIAKEIRSKLCYGEKSRIVVLFDPVGRQKEIVQAHNILIQWQQQFLAENHYPLTIGGFVEQLKSSDNKDIQKAVKNGIDQDSWNNYWLKMKQELDSYQERQRMFAKLYEQFMMSPFVTNCVGGLDSYFKYFFATAPSPKTQQDEFNKLADIASELFVAVADSEPGKNTLENIMSEAAESQRSFSDEHNVWGVLWNTLVPVLTEPQEQISWADKSVKAVDKILHGLASILGSAMYGDTWLARTTSTLSKAAMQQIKTHIPRLLHVMGIEILQEEELFTHEQLNQLAERIKQNRASFNKEATGTGVIEHGKITHGNLPISNKLFDWEHALPDANDPLRFRLPRVGIIAPQGNKFSFERSIGNATAAPSTLFMLFDTGFSGLSAFCNCMVLSSLVAQTSEYEKADPLARGNVIYNLTKTAAAITSLTVDVLNISKNVAKLISTHTAHPLAPKLGDYALALEGEVITKRVTGALALVNFLSAVVSTMDAFDAYQQGNAGEMVSNTITTVAYVSFIGISFAVMLGIIVAPEIVFLATASAFAMLIGGTVGAIYTKRSALENTLYNCFWGAGKQYGYWDELRGDINKQLKITKDNNEIDKIESRLSLELQEFINLFSMPKLDIIGKPKDFKFSYDEIVFYTFELPTFEPGLSDIQYCFYTQHPLKYIYNSERRPDERLNKLFNIAKKDAIRKMTTKDGVQTIAIPMEARQIYASQLEWYYIPSKEIIVPMRILNDKGELNSEYTIGMINEDVK
ncbi:toxin VasX [Hafnia paralvei]|uniref:toxin VasX n=1 Tax=Hafnia paralvei TaxID=546367 RepID=UPI003CF3B583